MKKLILTTLTVVCSLGVFAQGTVVFNNRVSGAVITHVYFGGYYAPIVANGSNDYSDTTMTPGTFNWSATGYQLVMGSTWCAQLLAAPGANQPVSALIPASPVTTFRTTSGEAGWVVPVTATLNGVPADMSVATIEMVAWDNSSGLYPTWTEARLGLLSGQNAAGWGNLFNVYNIGGIGNPPAYLYGLESFNIIGVPEPSMFALAALGGAALLTACRLKRG